jgi:hypothetical protein
MAGGLNAKFRHTDGFDPAKLQIGLTKFLPKHEPNYAPTAFETSSRIITRLGLDARVTDIRYMAYMLATACHEARQVKTFLLPVLAKNGKPTFDVKTQVQVTKQVKLYELFVPIEEIGRGAGKKYYEPIKIVKTSEGVSITEKDGDRFKVLNDGSLLEASGLSAVEDRGSKYEGKTSKKYIEAEGTEQAYFGRGLVQLTWWDQYLRSSVAFGYGLELLLNPEKVKDFDVAYNIMVMGMTTGGGFANGKMCSNYFTDNATNYKGARAMVNGTDKASDIAQLALAFETLLLNARVLPG